MARQLAVILTLGAWAACGSSSGPTHQPPSGSGGASGEGGGPTETGGSGGRADAAPGGSGGQPGSGGASGDAAPPRDSAADARSGGTDGAPPSDASPAQPQCVRKVPVANPAALTAALADGKPGDCLQVADGQYPGPAITLKATAAAPILIQAVNRRKAVFTSALTFTGAAWVTVEGFELPTAKITDSQHCRITRCGVKTGQGTLSINGTSDFARIDHCDIGGAASTTDIVNPGGFSTNTLIDHNHFHDLRAPHTITLGCCGATYDYHDTGDIAEYNLFTNCMSGAELFSVKSSQSTIRYNTVRMCAGDIDIRAGRNDSIYGNYIFNGTATFGIRMYEDGHRIYNNYVESARTISVGPFHEGHAQVKNATIVFNTFVGPVRFGDDVSTIFSNNVVNGPIMNIAGLAGAAPLTPTYQDNIVFPGSYGTMGFRTVDPQLARQGDVLVPAAGSPAAGAATVAFPFVTDDITGTPRGAKSDLGAQQLSGTGSRRPLTAADVGPDAP